VSRSETWSDEELTALLKVLLAPAERFEYQEIVDQRRKLAELLIVGRLTGMRPGEVRKLNRFQIDFKREIINVTSLKGGKPKKRIVPMNSEVKDILWRRAQEGEWIFSNPTGDNHMTEPYNLLRTACKRAGVKYGSKVAGGKVINDTRRTFENEALEAGHQPVAVARTLGHSVNTMVKHYLRTTGDQMRAVVNDSGKNYRGIFGVTTTETEGTVRTEESANGSKVKQGKGNSKNKGDF
jgi:integrase